MCVKKEKRDIQVLSQLDWKAKCGMDFELKERLEG